MHLKKLIISGFKSFADKVTLHFDEGITGIVGPNGSGKSNVIDAVRWVMGEQNAKHLRGQVATDIIFAGSDKRKALGMAEVTLVFDNNDPGSFCPPEYRNEPEIALSRRLYADGQREYLINRKPCRLKDIIGFFTLTGLGGRSYSMIQQGQVERILNAKPEDVREILEEAAGTIIFRNRRDAAQKKLAMTNDHLSRIEDIVNELSRQLEALSEQVDKAKKWQGLSSELKEKEISLLSHNFHHFSAELLELSQKSDQFTDRETKLLTEMTRLEAQVTELQQKLAESDPELDYLREDISKLREQIARAESVLTSAMSSIEQGEKRLIELEENYKADSEDVSSAREAVEKIRSEYDRVNSELENNQNLLSSFEDQYEQIDETARVFESRTEQLRSEINNIDRLLESNELRCESIERERQRLTREKSDCEEKIYRLREEFSKKANELSEKEQENSEAKIRLDTLMEKRLVLENSLQSKEEQLEELLFEYDSMKELIYQKKARFQSLMELEQENSDFKSASEDIAERDPAFHEYYHGFLNEFISYDSSSVGALSSEFCKSFDSWSDRLIIPSYHNFESIVDLLDKHSPCSLKVSVIDEDLLSPKDEVDRWAERFECEPLAKYLNINSSREEVVKPILERLFLIDSAQSSKSIFADMPQGVVLFDKRGMVFYDTVHLSMSRQAGGALSRKSELQQIESDIVAHEMKLKLIDDKRDLLKSDSLELKNQLAVLEEDLSQQKQESMDFFGGLQSIRQACDYIEERLNEAESELDRFVERDRSLVAETSELGEARISLGQQKDSSRTELLSLEDEFGSIDEQREEIQRQRHRSQLDFARNEARAKTLNDSLMQAETQLHRIEATHGRRDEERKKAELEIEQGRQKEAESRQEMEEYLARREELEEELSVRRERSSGTLDELRQVEILLKDVRKEHSELQKSMSSKEMDMERLKQASLSLLEQAKEKYDLDLMNHKVEIQPDFDSKKTTSDVQSLRKKIESLGAINMVAIEEYERLNQRYEFIQGQREEVTGTILLLEEAIFEIEETSREKFTSTFDVINQNFQELFPILFPGGEARLELTDPEDVLSGGVEIMVRMPGKTRRSMTLYSGGEKALTAISLIFALLKTKPTPFCFLDEVDAPLDEANVGRYNRVLETLSDRFQFIVITHNRRTMEVLDQLYGVTMQEGGVSTVVGVDMKKDLPAHLKKSFKTENSQEKRSVQGASTT